MQSYDFELRGTPNPEILTATQQLLAHLKKADFGKQFWQVTGRVAELGQENGEPKLDWVNGLADILTHVEWLDGVTGGSRRNPGRPRYQASSLVRYGRFGDDTALLESFGIAG